MTSAYSSYSTNLTNLDSPTPCKICNNKRYRMPNGRPRCSHCDSERNRKYHSKNIEKHKERVKNYYYSIKDDENSILYRTWISENQRCHSPGSAFYKYYGARGIKVFKEWRKSNSNRHNENSIHFENYKNYVIENLGLRPQEEYTIDRIDVYKGYKPGNIRWASRKIQDNNTRKNAKYKNLESDLYTLHYNNQHMTLLVFADITGLHSAVALYRYLQVGDNAEWILSPEIDSRFYQYIGNFYNRDELCLISGYSPQTITDRLNAGWPIFQLIITPEGFDYHDKRKPEILPDALEDHEIEYNGQTITLKEFSSLINMPLVIVIYRYKLKQSAEDIMADNHPNMNRRHSYQGHRYTTTELGLILGVSSGRIDDRINKRKWSVDEAMTAP